MAEITPITVDLTKPGQAVSIRVNDPALEQIIPEADRRRYGSAYNVVDVIMVRIEPNRIETFYVLRRNTSVLAL